jgi:hypothetical protein
MIKVKTIIDELTRLNREFWLKPLQYIINSYQEYDLNPEDAPKREIINILHQLKSNDSQLDLNAIFALEALNCFGYRAYSQINNHSNYWDPLFESYLEFRKTQGNKGIQHYQYTTSHPSSDIICRWFAKNLKYRQIVKAKANYATAIASIG